jgi:hypothetical protein
MLNTIMYGDKSLALFVLTILIICGTKHNIKDIIMNSPAVSFIKYVTYCIVTLVACLF